ncbi:plastocyanin/azurin family copper-binding protein [Aliifodinibius sp. S!AR15-10]|uniref:plastocyanin/azurin family copper-binding protein n=1 Tax=Aliifodinibius sp. S!AR15-10 TaxID=2950437 RepID=UPI0038F81451
MRFYVLLTIWILLIALTGCSKTKGDSPDKAGKTHIVEIKKMKFIPSEITVAPGDSVQWINRDIVAHNVTEEFSTDWKSPDLKIGESFTLQVNNTESYLCTLHPVMTGRIILKGD